MKAGLKTGSDTMNFIYRKHRGRFDDSMRTAVTFPSKEEMVSYIESQWDNANIELEPSKEPDERTGWYNEGHVLSDGGCIGMYGEIADVNDQQRIIDYLAGKLAEIANVSADKPVTTADIIELAERNVHK